jgi:predicted ferric reductase
MSQPKQLHYRGAPLPHRGINGVGKRRTRGDVAITAAGVGLGISLGMGVMAVHSGLSYPGGIMRAIGTLTALGGTYLTLMMLILIARLPWLEREVGHDKLVALHRKVAPYTVSLISVHVLATTISYAQAAETGPISEAWELITTTGWMMPAFASWVMMVFLAIISYRKIRMRMKYETWWVTHLYFYLAVALSFGHQVTMGSMFVLNPTQRYFWTGLYIFVAAVVIIDRVLRPIWISERHALRVAAVQDEGNGVTTVYVTGTDMDLLRGRGGQFFQWRFLTRHMWWQAHPYSLSASPNANWLRITVKGLGDHSKAMAELHPGTRVWAEGPYGVFHAAARHTNRIVAVAAGIGITPIRAMLDDIPTDVDVTVIYRVPEITSAALAAEIGSVIAEHGWKGIPLEGPPDQHVMSAELLAWAAPDVADSDLYVCGPPGFMDATIAAARTLGVPPHFIHHEKFAF